MDSSFLPPAVQASIHQALANSAFFSRQDAVVFLPPPVGLFSGVGTTSTHSTGMHSSLPSLDGIAAHGVAAQRHPSLSSFKALSDILNPPHSAEGGLNRRRGCTSETDSDDNNSQCSTISSDGSRGSQRSQRMERSAVELEDGRQVQKTDTGPGLKKRTWKVLLNGEQACEVRCAAFFLDRCGI